VLTAPDDLAGEDIRDALRVGWGFAASSLEYQPVGFGSHHWLAAARGARLFVTVDDLAAKLRTAHDSADDAFSRLAAAFATALSLHQDAQLAFVVAPKQDSGGRVLHRLKDRYSLVVHPYVPGSQVGEGGEFQTETERLAMLELLVEVHGARSSVVRADDFVVPHRHELELLLDDLAQPWNTGPYGERARSLLAAHARSVGVLLSTYDRLATRVSARTERMVVTHGEPHAGNVMLTSEGFVLVDWDTALLAPPERDLWDLCQGHAGVLDAYAMATGTALDQEALSLYRLWYDLAEIGGYLGLFRAPHTGTADAAQSWTNLWHFLQPALRWPQLFT